jgi:hypothetical protein
MLCTHELSNAAGAHRRNGALLLVNIASMMLHDVDRSRSLAGHPRGSLLPSTTERLGERRWDAFDQREREKENVEIYVFMFLCDFIK